MICEARTSTRTGSVQSDGEEPKRRATNATPLVFVEMVCYTIFSSCYVSYFVGDRSSWTPSHQSFWACIGNGVDSFQPTTASTFPWRGRRTFLGVHWDPGEPQLQWPKWRGRFLAWPCPPPQSFGRPSEALFRSETTWQAIGSFPS